MTLPARPFRSGRAPRLQVAAFRRLDFPFSTRSITLKNTGGGSLVYSTTIQPDKTSLPAALERFLTESTGDAGYARRGHVHNPRAYDEQYGNG